MMMTTSLTILTRRAALLTTSKRAIAPYCVSLLRGFSSKKPPTEKVPEEDYYHGHLMSDRLEYFNDMIDKTVKLEKSVDELKKKAAADAAGGVKWMESGEIDELFKVSSSQIAELKRSMMDAKKTFAVDAPDGESDWEVKRDMEEVNHIIDDAAQLEDTEAIKKQRQEAAQIRKETFAVDAPDGDSDGHTKEELLEVDHIIDDAAKMEDTAAIKKQRQEAAQIRKQFYAVDAPDGDSDGHTKEELLEVDHIIDDAAKLEDKNMINLEHKTEEKIRKEHARDPEHDW